MSDVVEKHQVAGLDEKERGFNRQVDVERIAERDGGKGMDQPFPRAARDGQGDARVEAEIVGDNFAVCAAAAAADNAMISNNL